MGLEKDECEKLFRNMFFRRLNRWSLIRASNLEVGTYARYWLSCRDEKDMFVLKRLACSSIPVSAMNSRVEPYGPELRN